MPRSRYAAALSLSLSVGAAPLLVAAGLVSVAGCKSPAPGVRATPFGIKQNIAASPAEIAEAAEGILADLELRDIDSFSTGLDSLTTGMSALGKDVRVSAKSDGTGVSNVYVNSSVGQGNAVEILRRINQEVGGSFTELPPEPTAGSSAGEGAGQGAAAAPATSRGGSVQQPDPAPASAADPMTGAGASSEGGSMETQPVDRPSAEGLKASDSPAMSADDTGADTDPPRRSIDSIRNEMQQRVEDGGASMREAGAQVDLQAAEGLNPEAIREQRVIPEK